MYRNLRVVPQMVFGRGSVNQLGDLLSGRRTDSGSPVVFLIDEIHEKKAWVQQLPLHGNDLIILVNVDTEPKTKYVDELTNRIKVFSNRQPDAIVGIGGGSTMDLAKAVSLLLTNPGVASDYQGWDLVKYPGIYHVGIPTLAGTGAEISRTAVLTGPEKKLGLNSDFTPFDQIILDPDLVAGVPRNQRFYTAMDCFIHAGEALKGTFINEFSRSYAEKSQALCHEVFLEECEDSKADEKLMIASYFGGMSIAYSQVGVCHALSYGLSYVLGVRHGVGNCIVFNHLEDFYPEDVKKFWTMLEKENIELPQNLTRDLNESQIEKMVDVALGLEPLWVNALGPAWKTLMTRKRLRALFLKM